MSSVILFTTFSGKLLSQGLHHCLVLVSAIALIKHAINQHLVNLVRIDRLPLLHFLAVFGLVLSQHLPFVKDFLGLEWGVKCFATVIIVVIIREHLSIEARLGPLKGLCVILDNFATHEYVLFMHSQSTCVILWHLVNLHFIIP